MGAASSVERTYILSLDSTQGNSHAHWHVARPPGILQQFHALTTETGIIHQNPDEVAALGVAIRAAPAS